MKRNSQTVLNVAFNGLTALEPLKALEEMRGGAYPEDGAIAAVVARLTTIAEYRRLFARAFGGGNTAVNQETLGRALAAFQRTLVAANAPFDRYMRGDTTALSPEQVRGMERFQSTGCINCHSGPMFSGLRHSCSRSAGQREATGIRFQRKPDIRLPNGVAAQSEFHGPVHA